MVAGGSGGAKLGHDKAGNGWPVGAGGSGGQRGVEHALGLIYSIQILHKQAQGTAEAGRWALDKQAEKGNTKQWSGGR